MSSFFTEFSQSPDAFIFLEMPIIPQIVSSLTAFAFPPGVLNTAMPSSVHLSIGILFTPAPTLAIARQFFENDSSFKSAERTIIAS